MKSRIKKALYQFGHYHRFGKRCPINALSILCYHGLTLKQPSEAVSTPNDYLHLSIRKFEKHMQFIREIFNPIELDDLLEFFKGRKELPSRSVLVTFDDGYKSIFRLAKPILEKYGIRPVIFITTQNIGTRNLLWPDAVFYHYYNLSDKEWELPKGYARGKIKEIRSSEKVAAIDDIIAWLKKIENDRRVEFLNKIMKSNRAHLPLPEECLLLNEDEIFALSALGYSIGSHSCTHPILAKLPLVEQEKEINNSKAILENITNKPIDAFAYPEGESSTFNDRTIDILKRCRYQTAVTTNEGYNEFEARDNNLFTLKRFLILGNMPAYEFCHRMLYSWPSKYRNGLHQFES